MAAARTCMVCDGHEGPWHPADRGDRGFCRHCQAAAAHVISMTLTRNDHGPAFSRARCGCGLLDVSVPRKSTAGRNRQSRLIREHWQAVVRQSTQAVA